MPPDIDDRYSVRALTSATSLARLGVIGAILVLIVAAFAWSAGWFSPNRLDQKRIVAAFVAAGGNKLGFRVNHAKGVCLIGWFDGDGTGVPFSRAGLFRPGRVPVFGRFSIAGPMVPDSPMGTHSMALNFTLPDGEVVKARELSGANGLLFRRNSRTGTVEALARSGRWAGLNAALHAND